MNQNFPWFIPAMNSQMVCLNCSLSASALQVHNGDNNHIHMKPLNPTGAVLLLGLKSDLKAGEAMHNYAQPSWLSECLLQAHLMQLLASQGKQK